MAKIIINIYHARHQFVEVRTTFLTLPIMNTGTPLFDPVVMFAEYWFVLNACSNTTAITKNSASLHSVRASRCFFAPTGTHPSKNLKLGPSQTPEES